MWAPLVNVNHLRSVPVNSRRSVGQWPPVCSSVHWQAMKTGTSILWTKVIGESGSATFGPVVVVALDLAEQVDRLGVELLVGLADLVAVLDPLVGPAWPPVGEAGSASWTRSLAHWSAKPVLRMPPGIERRLGVVDHRQRRDRGQARRPRRADEELADPAVGDPHHPDLVVQDPGLAGDRLDHVVAVEALERLEEVEGAARAAGAAHVDVDDREAERVGDRANRALAARRVRRTRSRSTRSGSGRGPSAGPAAGGR